MAGTTTAISGTMPGAMPIGVPAFSYWYRVGLVIGHGCALSSPCAGFSSIAIADTGTGRSYTGKKTMNYGWHDLLGNVGVVLVLVAYLLVQLERLSANRPPYLIANALGAFFILASLVNEFNLSAFAIEAAWLVISVYGLARYFTKASSETAVD